mgnify:CR=1 FL=1
MVKILKTLYRSQIYLSCATNYRYPPCYANSTSFVRLFVMSARVMNWMSRHKLVKKI